MNTGPYLLYREELEEVFSYTKEHATLNSYKEKIRELVKNIDVGLPKEHEKYQEEFEKESNKLKGDLFEIFAELLFLSFDTDPRFGIHNYVASYSKDDYGVDGVGLNVNNVKCVVQVKYRNNEETLIEYGDLAKCFTSGVIDYDLDTSKDNIVYLLTTSDSNYIAKNRFGKKLRVINGKYLRQEIDGNKWFWENCYNEIQKRINR